MRNRGLRIINYMINGRLMACLPIKVPMTTQRTVMLLFCLSIFVSGSSAVKGAHVGMPIQETETVVFTYLNSGECINVCMRNLIKAQHISGVNTSLRRSTGVMFDSMDGEHCTYFDPCCFITSITIFFSSVYLL